MTDEPPQRWKAVRSAVARHGARFSDLIRSYADTPQAMATSNWTVADTAAHVLSLVSHYRTLFDPDAVKLGVPDLPGLLARTTVDTVDQANAVVLRHLTERDPRRLADELDRGVAGLLDASRDCDPRRPMPWLGDARVPAAGVLAHLVNELLIHGYDVAGADARPWPMPDADAALFFEQFLVGMIGQDHGVLLETGSRPAHRPIVVDFRSPYTAPARLVLLGRRVTLGVRADPADARITFRPARFNLMLFGRVGVARSAMRRDIVIGGPRPWLLPTFLRIVHMPRG